MLEGYEGSGGAPQQQVLGLACAPRAVRQACCSEGGLSCERSELGPPDRDSFFRLFPNGWEGMVPNSLLRGKKSRDGF